VVAIVETKHKGFLAGRRILIVEDEMLLAMDLQIQLENEGCIIIGPAPNVAQALDAIAKNKPDAATLDINLNGETSAEIAGALMEMSVPFILTTGYGEIPEDPQFREAPQVKKPVNMAELIEKLQSLLN
jgi:DNA-binding response OmpR family regulator